MNFILFTFFFIFTFLIIYTNLALNLLLTAELLWVTLFAFALLVGTLFDNLNILSLTFFFLILSAVEFGVGLIAILFQHTLTRSTSFNVNESSTLKYKFNSTRLYNVNQTEWKI